MYINPFVAGVLATIGVEAIAIVLVFVGIVVWSVRQGKKSEEEKHNGEN